MEYTELSLKERQDILRRVQSETGMDLQMNRTRPEKGYFRSDFSVTL